MTPGADATYHCTVCGVNWSYQAVRHLACCRDCGSGLTRTTPTLDPGSAVDEDPTGQRQRLPGPSPERGPRPAAPIRRGRAVPFDRVR
ncbi:MAG: hypothetical protein ACRDLP_08735 [Solirubrobacteraceae bacterium]